MLKALLIALVAAGAAEQAQSPDGPVPRRVEPRDVALPSGYRIQKVLEGLTYPTAVAFDDRDRVYVVESGYAHGDSWAQPRLLRVEPDDRWTVVAAGDKNGPWTGAVFHKGFFYIVEGGELEGGKVLRVDPQTGRATTLVHGLPSTGDHPATGPVVGPDGRLYFGQGTMTNAGVVGADNEQTGWLQRHPERHDIPCADVTLTGLSFPGPRGPTGPFLPGGTPARPGQVIKGAFPCSGSVMRLPLEGAPAPELVAWGFRDPFGLAFSPKGVLFVADAGYDNRGSRPVWGGADLLWAVSTATWYGWPDFTAQAPVGRPLLASHPGKPPKPAALLGVHSSPRGFDFSRSDLFGHVGEIFVAQFGDLSPFSGAVRGRVGFKIVRVDPETGVIEDFAVNKGKANGPASASGSGGLERPVAARFSPDGRALYVADFGVVSATADGFQPRKGTGVLWKITRVE